MRIIRQWTLLPLLKPDGTITIEVPIGSRLLAARENGDSLCLWAEVDPDDPLRRARLRVARDGEQLRELEPRRYLGTGILRGGPIMHVYALGSDS